MRLDGAVGLVTGANRGIGAAMVDALLAQGASKVYATARRPQDVSAAAGVVPLRLDVTKPQDIASAAAAAQDVTVVVNNAGAGLPTSLLDGDLAAARTMMEVNFFGTWEVSRAFGPILAANGGGAFVNVLSTAAWWALGAPGYAASKAAEWALTNAMRFGLQQQGTQVLGVHSGYVDTEFSAWTDAPKITPAAMADETMRALKAGADEAVLDDFSRAVKAALSEDIGQLHKISPYDGRTDQ